MPEDGIFIPGVPNIGGSQSGALLGIPLTPPAGSRFLTETINGVTYYETEKVGGVTYYLTEAA